MRVNTSKRRLVFFVVAVCCLTLAYGLYGRSSSGPGDVELKKSELLALQKSNGLYGNPNSMSPPNLEASELAWSTMHLDATNNASAGRLDSAAVKDLLEQSTEAELIWNSWRAVSVLESAGKPIDAVVRVQDILDRRQPQGFFMERDTPVDDVAYRATTTRAAVGALLAGGVRADQLQSTRQWLSDQFDRCPQNAYLAAQLADALRMVEGSVDMVALESCFREQWSKDLTVSPGAPSNDEGLLLLVGASDLLRIVDAAAGRYQAERAHIREALRPLLAPDGDLWRVANAARGFIGSGGAVADLSQTTRGLVESMQTGGLFGMMLVEQGSLAGTYFALLAANDAAISPSELIDADKLISYQRTYDKQMVAIDHSYFLLSMKLLGGQPPADLLQQSLDQVQAGVQEEFGPGDVGGALAISDALKAYGRSAPLRADVAAWQGAAPAASLVFRCAAGATGGLDSQIVDAGARYVVEHMDQVSPRELYCLLLVGRDGSSDQVEDTAVRTALEQRRKDSGLYALRPSDADGDLMATAYAILSLRELAGR